MNHSLRTSLVLAASLLATSALATTVKTVPLKGTWSGVTTSADTSGVPLVFVVSEGSGQLSHLGAMTMIAPHSNDVFTGEIIGQQLFTAANGDTLTAECTGFAFPQPDGSASGSQFCEIVSGTGRFAGATGHYTFSLRAMPREDGGVGFATEARIEGEISTAGGARSGGGN